MYTVEYVCMFMFIYIMQNVIQSQRKNEIITFTEKCYETEKHYVK